MDSNIGKRLDGRYEITELIGVGGMADVYKAVDVMENRIVAVKVLKDEFSQNEEFLRRFRNESKAIAVLSHPNIVKIYDVGFTDEIQFIVMEYIDGITLKEFIEQQGVLRWKDALHFITQILRALQHAHDKGIVHRDIKPQNIMLFADGTIKVMDFGIARFSRVDGKTLSDKTIGSVHYISPEQARGDMTDERSDIYSVGVMLYEMLTGKKPFDGENPVAIALKHMQEVPVNPRDIMPSIPEALEEIVIHAMERNPARRYQSAAEMIKDIDTFKLNQSVVFGYKNNTVPSEDVDGATKFFKPITDKPVPVDEYDEDEEEQDDEEEEEEGKKRSYLVPILLAVTVAVVIIAAFIIGWSVVKSFGTNGFGSSSVTIENFVGQNIVDVEADYKDKLQFEVTQEYNSTYDEGVIFWQGQTAGKIVKEGTTLSLKVSRGPKMATVPDVVNQEYSVAENEMTKYDLIASKTDAYSDDVEEGRVIKTQPAAGEDTPSGSTVIVYVSKGPATTEVKVPNCLGLSEEYAIKLLKANKLTYQVEDVEYEGNKGKVVSQSTDGGEWAQMNDCITIGVSTGEVSPSEVNLPVQIPAGAWGAYTIKVYENGSVAFTQNIEDATSVAGGTVNVAVKGKKTETLAVYITNNSTKKTVENYCKFEVDFDAKTATLVGEVKTTEFADITPAATTTPTTTKATTPATTTPTTSETTASSSEPATPDDNAAGADN